MPAPREIRDYIRHHGDILDTIEALAAYANAMPQPTQNGTRLDVSVAGLRTAKHIASRCRSIQHTLKDFGAVR
jgi:hypothetical protein